MLRGTQHYATITPNYFGEMTTDAMAVKIPKAPSKIEKRPPLQNCFWATASCDKFGKGRFRLLTAIADFVRKHTQKAADVEF